MAGLLLDADGGGGDILVACLLQELAEALLGQRALPAFVRFDLVVALPVQVGGIAEASREGLQELAPAALRAGELRRGRATSTPPWGGRRTARCRFRTTNPHG